MNPEVFTKRRKIHPVETRRCIVPGYVLSFALDGLPYFEPAFATCLKREGSYNPQRPDIQGCAFLITESEFMRILATEGGSGWQEYYGTIWSVGGYGVDEVECVRYEDGSKFKAVTLIGKSERGDVSELNRPSQRYLKLVVEGARKSCINNDYIEFLEAQVPFIHLPAAKSFLGFARRAASIAFIFVMLPSILFMVLLSPLMKIIFGLDRSPWLLCKLLYVYNSVVMFYVHGCFAIIAGSGFTNNDEVEKGWLVEKQQPMSAVRSRRQRDKYCGRGG
jgi:hypothetical protein